MVEVLTGLVLATAAGLNAYIPLLGLGLLARFTPILHLPDNWNWLTSDWMLILLAVLLVVEMLVDKFPILDTVNDVLQTIVRPASGGMVFAAGVGSETAAVSDPAALFNGGQFWPVLIGIGVALIPHLLKAIARPALNAVTGGAGAAIASTVEDVSAILLTVLAVFVPVLAVGVLVALIWWLVARVRRARLRRAELRNAG